jgi:N-acetylneuraminate synthase
VLGAVALGARVVEKHFTDDNAREGPDHPFALDPVAWREMVDRTRELERALGSSHKFVTANEQETKVIQRRCVRAARDLEPGEVIRRDDLDVLRPYKEGSIRPHEVGLVVGHKAAVQIAAGAAIRWIDIVE